MHIVAPARDAQPATPTLSTAQATLSATGATGCIGWAPSDQSAACVEGRWGLGVDGDDRKWALVVHTGERETSVNLAPGPNFPAPGAVTDDPLPAERVAAAQRRLDAGGFRALASFAQVIAPGATVTAGSVRVRYTRTAARAAGENSAPQFNERIEILGSAATPTEVFSEDNVASEDPGPVVTVYAIPGGPLLVHRSAAIADEGVNEVQARAWVCDTSALRCH